jgi:type IV pilus assembly protein PilW
LSARGFTLVELLISLALAGMVVAGAIQLHASFNAQSHHQQEVSDIQQTLRVSMMILERAIRSAGAGLETEDSARNVKGGLLVENAEGECPGLPINHYAFEWGNSNVLDDFEKNYWPPGKLDQDTDPDWFRVLTVDTASGPVYTSGDDGSNMKILGGDVSNFNVGDLFQVVAPGGVTCIRQVTAGDAHGGATQQKFIQHNSGNNCFNPNPGAEQKGNCLANCGDGQNGNPPCLVRHIAAGGTVYASTPARRCRPRPAPRSW